jgi:glycosyltransferase involved in cell wall biosynthesis
MSQERLFSVIIPTRNRARLLGYALQSVLEQNFDDVEIIVSDNCSQDETPTVVQEAVKSGRVRYVRPERVLAMPDHWEFALEQATGQFVTYLCDDDAWAPDVLARVSKLLDSTRSQLVVLNSGIYYGDNWLDPAARNVASFASYTGEVLEYESGDTLRRLYSSCQVVYDAPRMLNSFCRREIIMRVKAASGRIFMVCPDYSFPSLMLTEIPSWLHIDEPLHLQGVFAEGIGSTTIFNRGEPSREFAREFDDSKLLRHVPLQAPVVSNYIAETLLMAKEKLPSKLGKYDIDWTRYFINCWDDVSTHEKNGVNVASDREEFLRVLAEQPPPVQSGVRTAIDSSRREPLIKQSVRKLINRSAVLTKFESMVRGRSNGSTPLIVPGADAGFDNILECARQLPGLAQEAVLTATGN